MISTTDIPSGGNGGAIPKTLQPGNKVVKINSIYLDKFPFADNAYNVMLDCEGADLGDGFEGFFIDKDNESLGRYRGQVGRVRVSQWAFEDKVLPSQVEIKRDVEIAKMLQNICEATGCMDWWIAEDKKHETIESLVEKMNEDLPFKDKFMNVCLGGREYENKGGYTNYDLFFPKFSKAGIPFENADVESAASRVYVFSEADHIIKKKTKDVEEVEEFDAGIPAGDGPVAEATAQDFEL